MPLLPAVAVAVVAGLLAVLLVPATGFTLPVVGLTVGVGLVGITGLVVVGRADVVGREVVAAVAVGLAVVGRGAAVGFVAAGLLPDAGLAVS